MSVSESQTSRLFVHMLRSTHHVQGKRLSVHCIQLDKQITQQKYMITKHTNLRTCIAVINTPGLQQQRASAFNRPIFESYSMLGRSPKLNIWELLAQEFLQAARSSCRPNNSIKALKDRVNMITANLIEFNETVDQISRQWFSSLNDFLMVSFCPFCFSLVSVFSYFFSFRLPSLPLRDFFLVNQTQPYFLFSFIYCIYIGGDVV